MKNLIVRSLSGAVFVILVIGSILLDPLVFTGLFFVISLLGLWEFYSLFSQAKYSPNRWLGMLMGGVLYLLFCMVHPALNTIILGKEFFAIFEILHLIIVSIIFLVLGSFVLILAEVFRSKELPFENVAITLMGLFYVVLPFGMMNFLFYMSPGNESSPHILLGIFLLVWTNDTFAYLSGMSLGKHPLCPRLSPKKTWEGSIGGAIFALLAAWGLSYFFKETSTLLWFIIGFIAIIFGTLGDLSESMLKRSLDIKDSGNIMPGHGGILDRFDAMLMATPFVFLVLYISNL